VPRDVSNKCTHGGRWLAKYVWELWGSHAAFCLDVPVKPRTLDRYLFDPRFAPRAAVVARIARALSRKLPTPVTSEKVLTRFGGRTQEDRQREEKQVVTASRPLCPICGSPIPRRLSCRTSLNPTCGFRCAAVDSIIRLGIETKLVKYIVAVVAAAVDVPERRIADLLHVPQETVTGWLHEWADLVNETRTAMPISKAKKPKLKKVIAHVLGIGPDALRILIRHRVRHSDRLRPVEPKYMLNATAATLAEKFDRTEEEILVAARRRTLMEFSKEHSPRASVQRFHLGTKKTRPLDPTTHKVVQTILREAWRGATSDGIAHALEDAQLPIPDDPMRTVRQHAPLCRPCRAFAAAYFHVRRGRRSSNSSNSLGAPGGTLLGLWLRENDHACAGQRMGACHSRRSLRLVLQGFPKAVPYISLKVS